MLTVHFEEDEDEEGQPHKRRILLSHVFKKSSSSNYSLRPCLSRSLSCYLRSVGRSSLIWSGKSFIKGDVGGLEKGKREGGREGEMSV